MIAGPPQLPKIALHTPMTGITAKGLWRRASAEAGAEAASGHPAQMHTGLEVSTGMDPTGTRKLLAHSQISCGIRPQARFGAGAPAPLRFHQPVSGSAPKYRGPCNTGEHQGTMRNHAFPKSARATSSRPDCPHLTFGASNCADLDTSSRRLNVARGQG